MKHDNIWNHVLFRHLLAEVSFYVCQWSLVFPCFLFCFGEQSVDSWKILRPAIINSTTKKSRCTVYIKLLGSKGSIVVRALASHQCGPGSNISVKAICGSTSFLVLSLAPKGYSLGTLVFPSPQKLTLPNSNAQTHLKEFIRAPKCFMGKQIITIKLQ